MTQLESYVFLALVIIATGLTAWYIGSVVERLIDYYRKVNRRPR